MIAVGGATWTLLIVSAAFGLMAALLVWAWLVGRLTIDLGWGRTLHPLGPIEVHVRAPRDVVYEVLAAPYLGRTPRGLRADLDVIDRGRDLVVAAHRTRVWRFHSTTVESVRFEPTERIGFRLLRGAPPAVTEQFVLSDVDDGCSLRYHGELAMDFWFIGRVAGRYLVKPTWEGVVRRHLDAVRQAAEARGGPGR